MSTTNGSFEIGDILEFMQELTSYGTDILATAAEIEELVKGGFEWFVDVDGNRLTELKESVLAMLDELSLQDDLIDTAIFEQIINQVRTTLEEALDGASLPPLDLDFSEALEEIRKVLPIDLPGIDLTELTPKVEAIIDTLASTGVSFRFLKDNPAKTAIAGDPTGASIPASSTALQDRGQSASQTIAAESEFEQILQTFFDTSPITALLEDLPNKMEDILAESGLLLELEEQLDALKNTLKNAEPLSIDLIITEFGGLANQLGKAAILVMKEIIGLIIDSFATIYDEFINLGEDLGDQINNLLSLLQLDEVENPSVFTLPAVLLAIPMVLVSKIGNTALPDFSGIPQDSYNVLQDPKFYGGNQLGDGVLSSIFGIANVKMGEDHPYELWVGLAEKSWGCLTGVLAQTFSWPNHHKTGDTTTPHDFPTFIWEYQWFMVAWSAVLIPWYYVKETRLSKSWPIVDLLEPVSNLLIETLHLTFFSIQFDKELNEKPDVGSRDDRIGAASILDPFPGLFGSAFELFKLGKEPFRNPNTPGKVIDKSIDDIAALLAINGNDSVGEQLSEQITAITAGDGLKASFQTAADALAAGGAIPTVVDHANQILSGNGAGSLEEAVTNLKNQLTINAIASNEDDFATADTELSNTKSRLTTSKLVFEELKLTVDPALGSWKTLENELTAAADPLPAKMESFEDHYTKAVQALEAAYTKADNLASLEQAEELLDPGSLSENTIGISLANGRGDLDAFHDSLKLNLQRFQTELNSKLLIAQPAADQDLVLDALAADIDPGIFIDGTIGMGLKDTRDQLALFKTDLEAALEDTTPNAIRDRMTGLEQKRDQSKVEIANLPRLFDPVIDGRLNGLTTDAKIVSNTLLREGTGPFATAYNRLLEELAVDVAGTGSRKIKDDFSQAIDASLAAANAVLNTFNNQFQNELQSEVSDAIANLNTASSLANEISALLNPFVSDSRMEEIQEAMEDVPGLIASLNNDLEQLDPIGDRLIAATTQIQSNMESTSGGSFLALIEAVKTDLSEAGSVGGILKQQEIALVFDPAVQHVFLEPQEKVDEITQKVKDVKEILVLMEAGLLVNTLTKKMNAIDEGLEKLKKIGSEKTKRKKREDSKFITYIPIISTLLIKTAYGGLNYWKGFHPSPIIGTLTSDPANPLSILASLDSIDGNYKDENTIQWEKKVEGEWESLDGSISADTLSITVDLEDLRLPIRAKIEFPPGFVSKAFELTNLAPVDIRLESVDLFENTDTAAPLEIGTLFVDDPNETSYRATNLALSGTDATSFQIIDQDESLMLQLQSGVSLDFETKSTYSITITATDPNDHTLSLAKDFSIQVEGVDEAPNEIVFELISSALTAKDGEENTFVLAAEENNGAEVLGRLLVADPEGETITFELEPAGICTIINENQLKLEAVLEESLSLTIKASDPGQLASEITIIIEVAES